MIMIMKEPQMNSVKFKNIYKYLNANEYDIIGYYCDVRMGGKLSIFDQNSHVALNSTPRV